MPWVAPSVAPVACFAIEVGSRRAYAPRHQGTRLGVRHVAGPEASGGGAARRHPVADPRSKRQVLGSASTRCSRLHPHTRTVTHDQRIAELWVGTTRPFRRLGHEHARGRVLIGVRGSQFRVDRSAAVFRHRAPWVEAAAGRDVCWVRRLAAQDLRCGPVARITLGDDRQQRLRVWMAGVADDVPCRTLFHDPAQVHHRDAVREPCCRRQGRA